MLSQNREKFRKITDTIARLSSALPLSPDAWTFISLVFALLSALMLYYTHYALSLILFASAGLCDMIDGAVARHKKLASQKGAYLDTIIDRYVEFIMLFTLILTATSTFIISESHWLILAIFGSLMTTYTKAAAHEKGLNISGGLAERAERIILILLIILARWLIPTYSIYLIVTFAILTNFTAIQRITTALQKKDTKDR